MPFISNALEVRSIWSSDASFSNSRLGAMFTAIFLFASFYRRGDHCGCSGRAVVRSAANLNCVELRAYLSQTTNLKKRSSKHWQIRCLVEAGERCPGNPWPPTAALDPGNQHRW